MQIKRRKASGKEYREWFVILAALLLGGLSLAILHCNGVQVCLLKRYTGYPCLLCGSTRAAFFLFHGEWTAAFAVQPLVALVLTAGTAAAAFSACLLCFRGQVMLFQLSGFEKKFYPLLAILLAILNWIYLLLR